MKNNKGFTLIELLAVIMVIGMLLVITSTSVIKVTRQSRDKIKESEFKSFLDAGKEYLTDVIESDGKVIIKPLTSDGDDGEYYGYNLLEYVGTCESSTYCKKSADSSIITRTIYFDSSLMGKYIDLEKFNATASDNKCNLKVNITVELNKNGYYVLKDIDVVPRDGVNYRTCVK